MQKKSKKFWLAMTVGLVSYIYFFVVSFSIPGVEKVGHYNIGNPIVNAIFFSYSYFAYSLSVFAGSIMYCCYSYAAFFSKKRIGFWLIGIHYAFAIFVAIPFEWMQSSNLWETSLLQWEKMLEQPERILVCFVPFLLGNVVYVGALLRDANAAKATKP